jgi:energy-converting hydrogenase B subunit Q
MSYRYNSQEMKQAVEAVIDKIEKNVELKEHYLSGLQHVYRVDGQYLLIFRYSKNKEGHYYFSVPTEFLNNLNIKHLVLICEDAERAFVLPSSQVNDLLEDVEPGNKGWMLDVYDKEGWEMKVARNANKVLYIDNYLNDYDLIYSRSTALAGKTAMLLICKDKPGVLRDIAGMVAKHGGNITYTQQFIVDKGINEGLSSLYIEVEEVRDIDDLVVALEKLNVIQSVSLHAPLERIFGQRVIIVGGGAQVAQVAMGAINEADRHNLRGERISVDTIPLVGEDNLADAVEAVKRLHRAQILVLAGSIMGGRISEEVKKLHEEGMPVISLNMAGSVPDYADLVVTDPIQAGTFAVMHVAKTAVFDIERVRGKKF